MPARPLPCAGGVSITSPVGHRAELIPGSNEISSQRERPAAGPDGEPRIPDLGHFLQYLALYFRVCT